MFPQMMREMLTTGVLGFIPFFEFPNWQLGPLTVGVFGIFAALGIYAATEIAIRQCKRRGLDVTVLADYAPWGIAGGVAVGHWVHLFAYHPEELGRSPWQILKIWDGLSSFGGLLGGIIAAVIYFRIRRVSFRAYGDAFALGVAPGWGIARVGCFLVHDHPGVKTDFPLAVAFPDGPRHDLGLYDALWLFGIAVVLFSLMRQGLLKDRLLPLLALLYAPARFFFDFLRATDVAYRDARYAGLTPAQYCCIALVLYGVYELLHYQQTVNVKATA
jgi:phosphatidylglycerol:prolipoprotein diacylglycerol transferase